METDLQQLKQFTADTTSGLKKLSSHFLDLVNNFTKDVEAASHLSEAIKMLAVLESGTLGTAMLSFSECLASLSDIQSKQVELSSEKFMNDIALHTRQLQALHYSWLAVDKARTVYTAAVTDRDSKRSKADREQNKYDTVIQNRRQQAVFAPLSPRSPSRPNSASNCDSPVKRNSLTADENCAPMSPLFDEGHFDAIPGHNISDKKETVRQSDMKSPTPTPSQASLTPRPTTPVTPTQKAVTPKLTTPRPLTPVFFSRDQQQLSTLVAARAALADAEAVVMISCRKYYTSYMRMLHGFTVAKEEHNLDIANTLKSYCVEQSEFHHLCVELWLPLETTFSNQDLQFESPIWDVRWIDNAQKKVGEFNAQMRSRIRPVSVPQSPSTPSSSSSLKASASLAASPPNLTVDEYVSPTSVLVVPRSEVKPADKGTSAVSVTSASIIISPSSADVSPPSTNTGQSSTNISPSSTIISPSSTIISSPSVNLRPSSINISPSGGSNNLPSVSTYPTSSPSQSKMSPSDEYPISVEVNLPVTGIPPTPPRFRASSLFAVSNPMHVDSDLDDSPSEHEGIAAVTKRPSFLSSLVSPLRTPRSAAGRFLPGPSPYHRSPAAQSPITRSPATRSPPSRSQSARSPAVAPLSSRSPAGAPLSSRSPVSRSPHFARFSSSRPSSARSPVAGSRSPGLQHSPSGLASPIRTRSSTDSTPTPRRRSFSDTMFTSVAYAMSAISSAYNRRLHPEGDNDHATRYVIGEPFNIRHPYHVEVDPLSATGFKVSCRLNIYRCTFTSSVPPLRRVCQRNGS
jgi:hypothetical protein